MVAGLLAACAPAHPIEQKRVGGHMTMGYTSASPNSNPSPHLLTLSQAHAHLFLA